MQENHRRPIVFTATGAEYFRIWIVNLLLTIVTLGIYSAWAKVRRLRYFYGHTLVDQSPFEFHGDPRALFKGRLIGVLLLLAYSQAAKVSIVLWYVVVAFLIAIFPYLIWKSLRFRLFNSSYRGIRFGFDGALGGAYGVVTPMMLVVIGPTALLVIAQRLAGTVQPSMFALKLYGLSLLAVVLLVPWFYFALRGYQIRNARLGTTRFAFDGRVGGAYAIFGKTIGLFLLLILLAFVVVFMVGVLFAFGTDRHGGSPPILLMALGSGLFYLLAASFTSFTRAMIQNFAWNHTSLAGVPLQSEVGAFRLWRIDVANLVLTLVTLGFFWPFAVVRSMRYRVESVSWAGDPEGLIAQSGDDRSGATGEETADLFGFDIAL